MSDDGGANRGADGNNGSSRTPQEGSRRVEIGTSSQNLEVSCPRKKTSIREGNSRKKLTFHRERGKEKANARRGVKDPRMGKCGRGRTCPQREEVRGAQQSQDNFAERGQRLGPRSRKGINILTQQGTSRQERKRYIEILKDFDRNSLKGRKIKIKRLKRGMKLIKRGQQREGHAS